MRPSVRVVSWNLMNPAHGRAPERIATATGMLRTINADVLCLQESWPEGRDRLADALGMRVAAQSAGESSCAVLTRLDIEAPDLPLDLPHDPERSRHAAAVLRSASGRRWQVTSTHLAWGGAAEGHRLAQAVALDAAAEQAQALDPDLVCVLAGDFNTVPQSATVRFLTGLDPRGESSTLWVDAWQAAGEGAGITSDPGNQHAAATAAIVGILDPSLIPPRRIDYVMVRGWAYGRPGSVLRARLTGEDAALITPSDHYAVIADLWDPTR